MCDALWCNSAKLTFVSTQFVYLQLYPLYNDTIGATIVDKGSASNYRSLP